MDNELHSLVICNLSISNLQNPVPYDITSVGSTYHMHKETCDGHEVLIENDWFRSDGVKYGIDKKKEMFFNAGGNMRLYLHYIECEAVQQLKVPVEVLQNMVLQMMVLEVRL